MWRSIKLRLLAKSVHGLSMHRMRITQLGPEGCDWRCIKQRKQGTGGAGSDRDRDRNKGKTQRERESVCVCVCVRAHECEGEKAR